MSEKLTSKRGQDTSSRWEIAKFDFVRAAISEKVVFHVLNFWGFVQSHNPSFQKLHDGQMSPETDLQGMLKSLSFHHSELFFDDMFSLDETIPAIPQQWLSCAIVVSGFWGCKANRPWPWSRWGVSCWWQCMAVVCGGCAVMSQDFYMAAGIVVFGTEGTCSIANHQVLSDALCLFTFWLLEP